MLNEHIHGFTVTDTKDLPELQGVLYRMTHDRTGLELVWLKRNEENKTFGIAFETLPWDDTGVFHILEHSVLCGSDKYPVKEPFVELLKSSLTGYLSEPHSTLCSRMWNTPVSSSGMVLKPMQNSLLLSLLLTQASSVPVFS